MINELYRWQFSDSELRRLKIDRSHKTNENLIVDINYIVYNIAIYISAKQTYAAEISIIQLSRSILLRKITLYYFATIPIILFIINNLFIIIIN